MLVLKRPITELDLMVHWRGTVTPCHESVFWNEGTPVQKIGEICPALVMVRIGHGWEYALEPDLLKDGGAFYEIIDLASGLEYHLAYFKTFKNALKFAYRCVGMDRTPKTHHKAYNAKKGHLGVNIGKKIYIRKVQ